MLNLKNKLVLNAVVDLVALITMVIAMLHFVYIISPVHGTILLLAYLAREVMSLQAKALEKEAMGNFLNSMLPKDKPNLAVVETDDKTTNETTH